MSDRDLVVIQAVGSDARDNHGKQLDPAAVRTAVGLPSDRFGAALVGKDGGVKMRSTRTIPTEELFRTIDAMPMRQQEMRR